MKKSIVALVSLAGACVASAQSSVTLFGVIDIGISGYKNESVTPLGGIVSTSKTALSSGNSLASRIGFRGTEDLGGGLAASFWLEAGISPNSGIGAASGGGLDFNRRSTVSLSGSFGELRLGRDYTPSFWNDTIFDPFGSVGVGASLLYTANAGVAFGVPNSGFKANTNYIRASNSVGYFLPPTLGGFYGQLMYAFNGQTSYDPGQLTPPGAAAILANPALAAVADNARAGQYIGTRFGYATGPLDASFAAAHSTVGSNYYAGSTTQLDTWSLGASYDFNVVKISGEYSNNKEKTNLASDIFNSLGVTSPGANGALIALTIPIGAGQIKASYSAVKYNNLDANPLHFNSTPKADQFAVGYVYNLSKRTALYATAAYIKNENGASLSISSVGAPTFYAGNIPGVGVPQPSKSMGYDLGIRHAF